VSFQFDGVTIPIDRDEMTVAAALWKSGVRSWRVTDRGQRARGYYCGTGTCYDCLVTIDEVSNQLACVTRAQPGMRVVTQIGFGVA
jgi:hypothetical protein